MTKYTIAEARHNLAAIVHEAEAKGQIELTRRGEPVAVLLSVDAYRRLTAPPKKFGAAYKAYLASQPVTELDGEPDLLADVRDRTPGREVDV
ncbi:MAG: type II toxin-antitoxin system Phd/YefM family antitoxin [Anaerolineales bacterium]|nr:type II toxin-antitoxin system Phd/YefM family antitoxin [Anaerolineales bacterium]